LTTKYQNQHCKIKSNLLLPATNSSAFSQQISPNALYASHKYPGPEPEIQKVIKSL